MKRSTKFWIGIGIIFSIVLNIIVWSDDQYYGANKGTEAQDLLFAFVAFNLDPLLIILLIPIFVEKFNKWIDGL